MQATAQRLQRAGLPMVEFPQTTGNLTDASSNLYETIKAHGFIAYKDDAIRLAMQRAVAVEGSRGWRITKEKTSHKIDIVVALGMCALATVRESSTRRGQMAVTPARSAVESAVALTGKALSMQDFRAFRLTSLRIVR
jgi:phage terminase large subunit-like protein